MSRLCGIGTDIAEVARFSRLFSAHGAAFAEKWFTPSEVEEAVRMPQPGRLLAERFAVKEAVWKALGPTSWTGPLPWRGIATERSHARGPLRVKLTGRVAAQAETTTRTDTTGDTTADTQSPLRIHASVSSTAELATAVAMVTRD